ncbi:MAG TPA: helix-turn-helix domain-containing protein, partial [Stellaceae bacterium]|nr:helix-turn-helix domain-containing protein [Stellaceae bacterium]
MPQHPARRATAGGPFLTAPDPPGQQRENWCAERHTRPAGATAGGPFLAALKPGPPGQQREIKRARRYLFALYPTAEQKAVLQRHSEMLADLWNGLLQRYEHIQRTTTQRQVWFDTAGRHSGVSYHRLTWGTY